MSSEEADLLEAPGIGQALERRFTISHPDYVAAVAHYRTVRAQQLRRINPDTTREQINEHLQKEACSIVREALKRSTNPAEALYGLALTLGYVPEADPTDATTFEREC
jgi:hypothetical protein